MEIVRLYSHTNSMVWEMKIPKDLFGPDVIVWGAKVFKFDTDRADQVRNPANGTLVTYRRFNEVTAHFIT